MNSLEIKADAFLEAIELLVAEADGSGLSPVAVARLLFGSSVLLLEARDGPENTARAMRHQLNRIERSKRDSSED